MKTEKIKIYNQKILAVLGTVALLFLTFGLIFFIYISIQEMNRYNYEEPETGILSEEKIEELQKESKRLQVISYDNPILIDTLKLQYIIPVSHRTLGEKEELLGLLNGFTGGSGDFDSDGVVDKDIRYSREYYGHLNNIVLYNAKTGANNKLFNNRINFERIDTEYFNDDILIIIKASEEDTYKDGVINLKDLGVLYLYSTKEERMRKIRIAGMHTYRFHFIKNTKDLILELGVDKNNDGTYERYNEPVILKKYDFSKDILVDIIDEKINEDLQKALEGTKK